MTGEASDKSVKYDPNQPRVPAGHSDGGQWTDGGGGVPPLIINTYSADRYFEGERAPTNNELSLIQAKIRSLSPELQRLRPDNDEVWVTIENGKADTRGNRISIDEKWLRPDGMVMEHEYLHSVISNNQLLDETIMDRYSPPWMYRHTNIYGNDYWSANAEQLVMNLTAFDSNREKWIDNVMQIEKAFVPKSRSMAIEQIEAVEKYLKEIGIW